MTQEQFNDLKNARQAAYRSAQEQLSAELHANKLIHAEEMRELQKLNPGGGGDAPRVNHERWVKEDCYDLLRYVKGKLIHDFKWDRQEFVVPEPDSGEKLAGGFTIEQDKIVISITIPRVKHVI